MAETETGWTKEWPNDSDSFYWMRDGEGRYRDRPVHVTDDKLLGLFDHSYFNRRDIEGQVELLGPISPSDAEQLIELRKAARIAATWIEQSLFDRPHDEQGDTVVASLLMALNPKQPQKETQK